MIELLKFILLAVIQGISEVLPISSSGHLQIVQEMLGMDTSSLTVSIFLHLGSLVAMIVFYRKLVLSIIGNSIKYVFKSSERNDTNKNYLKLLFMIVIACIPAGLIGLLFKNKIESIFANTIFIGINLIITGCLLFLQKYIKGKKTLDRINWLDAIIIGLFQTIGILPGISRSGITTIGGKVSKLQDEDAINFAFLLFIPVTLGTGLLEVVDIIKGDLVLSSNDILLYIVGIIISGLVTYIALSLLLKIIKKGKLHYFAYYCFVVGLAVIIWQACK